jgi:hypothetical protein
MSMRSLLITVLAALIAAVAYATLTWQIRERFFPRHASAEPPTFLPALTVVALVAADVSSAFLSPGHQFVAAWTSDRVVIILRAVNWLLCIPILTAFLRRELAAPSRSREKADILLSAAGGAALITILTSVGNLISGKVTPPLDSLPLVRRAFYVYQGIIMYVIYLVTAFGPRIVRRNTPAVGAVALNVVVLTYVAYFVGMITLYLYFPSFYGGKSATFLNHLQIDTFVTLFFIVGIYLGAISGQPPVAIRRWVPIAFIANILLGLSLPTVVPALEQIMGFAKTNTVLVIATVTTTVVTVITTRSLEAVLTRDRKSK